MYGQKRRRSRDPIVGSTYGHLKVVQRLLDRTTGASNTRARVLCQCSCGKRLVVTRYYLLRPEHPVRHCGCQRAEITSHKFRAEYTAWQQMNVRCSDPKHHSYATYGGRGIKVCDRWSQSLHGFQGFLNFFHDLKARPKGMSLDRIDPDKGYNPDNVRWATAKQQTRNRRSTKKVYHPKTGELVVAADLAEELGLKYWKLRQLMIANGTWDAHKRTS